MRAGALLLGLLAACSSRPLVVLEGEGPGLFALAIARLDGTVEATLQRTTDAPDALELESTSALLAVSFVPLAELVRPDGAALTLEELGALRLRARTAPAAEGTGACERCLVPLGAPPKVLFPGESCAPPRAPALYSLDHDGAPVADANLAESIRRGLRLDAPGACAAEPLETRRAFIAAACPVAPDGAILDGVTMAANGVVATGAYDRAILVGPDGDREEVPLGLTGRALRPELLDADETKARFVMLGNAGEARELRVVEWDRSKPAGQRARSVPLVVPPLLLEPVQVAERGEGRFAIYGAARRVGSIADCRLDGGSVVCEPLALDSGGCPAPSGITHFSGTSSLAVASTSDADVYLAEGRGLRCAGRLEAPGRTLADAGRALRSGDALAVCVGVRREVEPNEIGVLFVGLEGGRLAGPGEYHPNEPSDGCTAIVRLGAGFRVFFGSGRVMDVERGGARLYAAGEAPHDLDRPALGIYERFGRELAWAVDGTVWLRPLGGERRRLLGPERFEARPIELLGATVDGTQLALHPGGGLLELEDAAPCPRLEPVVSAELAGATALASDSREARALAVATSSAGTRAVIAVELGQRESGPILRRERGPAISALVELAPGRFVAVDAQGVALEIAGGVATPIPVLYDDPRTPAVEGGAARWRVASGGHGEVWLGGETSLGRVLAGTEGLRVEAFWYARFVAGQGERVEVEAVWAPSPGTVLLGLASLPEVGQTQSILDRIEPDGAELVLRELSRDGPYRRIVGLAGASADLVVRETSLVRSDLVTVGAPPGLTVVGRPGAVTLIGQAFGRATALITR